MGLDTTEDDWPDEGVIDLGDDHFIGYTFAERTSAASLVDTRSGMHTVIDSKAWKTSDPDANKAVVRGMVVAAEIAWPD